MTSTEAMTHFMKGWMQESENLVIGPIFGLFAGVFFGLVAPFLNQKHVDCFRGSLREYRLATWIYFTIAACLHFTFTLGIASGLDEIFAALGVPDFAAFFLSTMPTLFCVLFLSKLIAETLPKFGPLVKEFNRSFFEASKRL